MITVIKQPVYLSIETEVVDRALVSKATREVLYPRLIEFLSNAKFRSEVIKEFNEIVKSPSTIKILTEVDVMNKLSEKD